MLIKSSKSYKIPSDNHFSHMNMDENSTPDRFEKLPELKTHLKHRNLMVLKHLYEHFLDLFIVENNIFSF